MILLHVGPAPTALRAPEVAAGLVEAGHHVEVVLGPGARYFVGPAAFAPYARVVERVAHTSEALVFVAATAGEVARLARGLGGGVAHALYAEGVRPVVVVPDLDGATGSHPAVRRNLELLRDDGCRVLDEPSPLGVAGAVLNLLGRAGGGALSGVRVLVTAGGTREPIDKVRFVGNRSSGKMGRAVAREAWRRGAEVTVVAANVEEREPGVDWVAVEDYAGLEKETLRLAAGSDVLVMAAAVSDFTPEKAVEGKIRRGDKASMDLKLVATGDILKSVRKENPGLFVVGFAATFGDPVPDAGEKLAKKDADLIVGNDVSLVGSGFGSDENEVHVVGRGAEVGATSETFVARAPKGEVARAILDEIEKRMRAAVTERRI